MSPPGCNGTHLTAFGANFRITYLFFYAKYMVIYVLVVFFIVILAPKVGKCKRSK
jgi:hypothetical protein